MHFLFSIFFIYLFSPFSFGGVFSQTLNADYFRCVSGQCYQCGEKVTGANEACQAMGNLYHTSCFVCCSCGKSTQTFLTKALSRGAGPTGQYQPIQHSVTRT